MKCYYHPEAEAVQECRLCNHPLCPACVVLVKGAPYCPDCLQSRVEGPAVPAAPLPAGAEYRSPRAAGWLSLMPGLGLLYLGQYMKALVVGLMFMGAIHVADRSEAGGILPPLIWFGQIFYAVQEAKRLNRRRAGSAETVESDLDEAKDSPLWGGILVGLGTLFLLDQFDLIRFTDIFEKFWPLLIIGLGLQILLRGRRKGMDPSRP